MAQVVGVFGACLPLPLGCEAKARYVYGQLHAAMGELARVREHYAAALAICGRLGEGLYRPHIEQALANLGNSTA